MLRKPVSHLHLRSGGGSDDFVVMVMVMAVVVVVVVVRKSIAFMIHFVRK